MMERWSSVLENSGGPSEGFKERQPGQICIFRSVCYLPCGAWLRGGDKVGMGGLLRNCPVHGKKRPKLELVGPTAMNYPFMRKQTPELIL